MPVQDSDGRTVLLLVGFRHDADVFARYHGYRPEILTVEGCEGRDLTECTIIKYGSVAQSAPRRSFKCMNANASAMRSKQRSQS